MSNEGSDRAQAQLPRSAPWRLWLRLPDGFFRIAGALAFGAFILPRVPQYLHDFWGLGYFYRFSDDRVVRMPWGQVLVDVTFLLVAVSFAVRVPPRARATGAREVVLPLMAAFLPFVPWWALTFGELTHAAWLEPYRAFLIHPASWRRYQFIGGSALIVLGNALDVWGYLTLLRSFSITAEARELKVTGPYRLVRHPIYLGHMIAQAGVWLFYASPHLVWFALWALFAGLQLYRSKIEDEVLERAFGERYLLWKRKTFWFV